MLGENLLQFTQDFKLLTWNENMDVSGADNYVKNWQYLPISNPEQGFS